MKPQLSKLLILVLLAMSWQLPAKEPEASDTETVAAALDADEIAAEKEKDTEKGKAGTEEKSNDQLQLLDRTGEITRQDLRDALPKGFIIGAAAINIPDRYSESDQNFYAVPGLMYIGDRFLYLGDRASYALARGDHLTFNVNARYRFRSLDPDDVPEFNTLNPRDGQLEAGFGLSALTPVGFFTSRINADVSGKSNGYLAGATWFLPYYKKGLLIMPAIGFRWYDSNFSNYYFGGVSPEEANPLLPAFDTGSTTEWNGILTVGYRFNQHWFVTGGAVYSYLSSNVVDSPVLLSRDQTIVFGAVGYIWE
jgi:outer membrane protein